MERASTRPKSVDLAILLEVSRLGASFFILMIGLLRGTGAELDAPTAWIGGSVLVFGMLITAGIFIGLLVAIARGRMWARTLLLIISLLSIGGSGAIWAQNGFPVSFMSFVTGLLVLLRIATLLLLYSGTANAWFNEVSRTILAKPVETPTPPPDLAAEKYDY